MAVQKKEAGEAPSLKVKQGAQELGKLGDAVGLSTKGQKKGNALFLVVPMSKLRVQKDFNPRTHLGDIAALAGNIKKEGVINPLTVRPIPGESDKFYIVAGHRRLAACKEAGIDDIPVMIRTDIPEDADARAVAVSENSEDARTSLNHIEMGRQFAAFEKEQGWSVGVIAGKCGVHEQTVRRCLKLMDAPADVQKRVESGTLAVTSALEYAKLDDKTRKQIADSLNEGISAKQVRELGKKAAKEAGATGKGKANKQKGQSRDASLATWKGSKVKQEEIVYHCYLLIAARDAGDDLDTDVDLLIIRGIVQAFLWDRGDFERPLLADPNDPENLPEGVTKKDAEKAVKHFWSLVESEAKKYVPPAEEAEAEKEAEPAAK